MNAIAPVSAFKQALTTFEGQISTVSQQLSVSLPSHISIEKFQRTLMAAVKADPELLKADRASLINACEKAALDGLLPDKREAALVIFKRNYKDAQGAWQQALEVAYMPMVYGLRKKILQSGEITDITAKVVYRVEAEEGRFIYEEGTERMLRHKPKLDISEEDAKDECIVAAYSMATYKDGSTSYEVMRRFEVDKVRECSQTGATRDKKGQPRRPSGPWVDWYPEQAKKTVMRRHSKTLPMSGDLMIDVEGRELETSASSTARMLSVEPDAPLSLPGTRELDEQDNGEIIDQDTGEVIRTDARGFTEVDEETARQLDTASQANEGPADEQRGEAHTEIEADFNSANKPGNAVAGQTWYDGEKLRYAHQTPAGIKWYLEPQVVQSESEAAAETVRQIDGPLEEGEGEQRPAWRDWLDGIEKLVTDAATKRQIDYAESEYLKNCIGLPKDVANKFEAGLMAKRKQLAQPAA